MKLAPGGFIRDGCRDNYLADAYEDKKQKNKKTNKQGYGNECKPTLTHYGREGEGGRGSESGNGLRQTTKAALLH